MERNNGGWAVNFTDVQNILVHLPYYIIIIVMACHAI